MKTILKIIFSLLLTCSASFAYADDISFDSANNGAEAGAGQTTASWTHTTGSCANRLGIVGIQNASNIDDISTPTWNGVNMLKMDNVQNGSASKKDYIYYIINPPVGAVTVSVVRSNTSNFMDTGSDVWCGVDQINPFVSTTTGSGSGTTFTQSITNTYFGGWDVIYAENNTAGTSASTNTTFRSTDGGGGTRGLIGDSNGPQTPGSFSMSVTGNGSSAWRGWLMQLRKAVVSPSRFYPF